MYKIIAATALAAGLILAPMPTVIHGAAAQDAKSTSAKATKTTTAQTALRERQKKCGDEWKAAKKAGKIEKGMKWPQYWSACNKRLKSAGA